MENKKVTTKPKIKALNKALVSGSTDLRNHFAGLAMQSLITKENLKGGMNDYVVIARHAYCCADAMIAEM
jgi:hypothetical protein